MKIKQIVAAHSGWVCVFKDSSGEIESPVAMWAVVEEDGVERVTSFSPTEGMDGLSEPDDKAGNFFGWRSK